MCNKNIVVVILSSAQTTISACNILTTYGVDMYPTTNCTDVYRQLLFIKRIEKQVLFKAFLKPAKTMRK